MCPFCPIGGHLFRFSPLTVKISRGVSPPSGQLGGVLSPPFTVWCAYPETRRAAAGGSSTSRFRRHARGVDVDGRRPAVRLPGARRTPESRHSRPQSFAVVTARPERSWARAYGEARQGRAEAQGPGPAQGKRVGPGSFTVPVPVRGAPDCGRRITTNRRRRFPGSARRRSFQ